MAHWVVTTAKTLSDMDGGGTEFADGDRYTANSGAILTGDTAWSGADGSRGAGGDCTVNNGAIYYQENTVKFYFKTGFDFVVNQGNVKILGESGGGTEFGSADTSNRMANMRVADASMYVSYCDFGYGMSSFIQFNGTAIAHFYNCTIKEDTSYSLTFFLYGGSKLTLEECTVHTTTAFFNTDNADFGVLTAINTTFTGGSYVMVAYKQMLIYWVGTSNWDGDYEPDATWWTGESRINRPILFKYNKLTVSESNNVSSAIVGFPTHLSQDAKGMFEWESTETLWRTPMTFWATPSTDASGDSVLYLLQYIMTMDINSTFEWKYVSDSGQAETGDNQKYTITMTKAGHSNESTTAWADGSTASLTLTVAPVIATVTLSDSSIAENEETTLTITADDNTDVVAIEVNSTYHEIPLTKTVGTVTTWEAVIKGKDIGTCTTETITVYASNTALTDSDTSASITVTAATQMYAAMIMDVLNQLQDDMQGASSSYAYLNALDDECIMLGYRDTKNQFQNDAIYIELETDDIDDITVRATQESEIDVPLVVVCKNYEETALFTQIVNLVGDVYDLFMALSNRDLSDNCVINTVTRNNWGYHLEGGNTVLRWCEMTLTIKVQHVVT